MTFSKDNPFLATITERQVLNLAGSQKCTVHLSLDISGSHLQFKVGDSIGVYPQNSSILVKEILKALQTDKNELITHPRSQKEMSAFEYLTSHANLSKVTKKWIQFAIDYGKDADDVQHLKELLEPLNKDNLKAYCQQRQLWDFLAEYAPLRASLKEALPCFGPLLPRFYSIASSPLDNPNRIDLLIAYFKYMTNKHLRHGVASHYLCELAQLHSPEVQLYIHPSKNFTLPEDHNTPIIMIGPGTGVAPFRAFMQERVASCSSSQNWLFFGDWNQKTDFYYGDYFQQLEQKQQLKLSLAFSRDQEHKVYVQHKMFEEAQELWNWINQGAIVYVCGDATHMAKDVEQALFQIISEQGDKGPDETKAYLQQMKDQGRYQRDVY